MATYNIAAQEELTLHSYLPTSFHDWLLIDLWGKMERDGSLKSTFIHSTQNLLAFCQLLAKPGETRIALDQNGPYFCAWMEPLVTGVSLGLWIREDKRKSRQCLIFAHSVLEELFKQYSTIVVITRNEMVKKFHEHFGFVFGCAIPHIYDGDTAYISYLTEEDYKQRFLGQRQPLDFAPSYDPTPFDIPSLLLSSHEGA